MSERGDFRLGSYTAAVEARLARWQEEEFGRRLWEKDYQLWSPEPIPEADGPDGMAQPAGDHDGRGAAPVPLRA